MTERSYMTFTYTGLALDPIHVGTGGSRLGRVDNTIVRDPVTRIPKIPGSSLAGVMRTYAAMYYESNKSQDNNSNSRAKSYYPDCAGQGGGSSGHCGQANCEVCTVFGFAKGRDSIGGFAGLASFSDMHVLLFPVASQLGPQWLTCPMSLRQVANVDDLTEQETFYYLGKIQVPSSLNLGWLHLPVKTEEGKFKSIPRELEKLGVPSYIIDSSGIVSDKLFSHIVNSNLEVRTSVAINPATGAAEEKALFTYEAIPRGTVLIWEVICRNPKHFKIREQGIIAVQSPGDVSNVIVNAYHYLEHLGIGGMGSRGMGRLRVLNPQNACETGKTGEEAS